MNLTYRPKPIVRELDSADRDALRRLVDILESNPDASSAEELDPYMRTLFDDLETDAASFFPMVYDLVIGRPSGPKFTLLVTTIGIENTLPLLRASLHAAMN